MRYAQLIMGPAGSGKVGKLVYWTLALQVFLKTIVQKSLGQGKDGDTKLLGSCQG